MERKYSDMSMLPIKLDLSRKEIFELGRKVPYYKYIDFPVEILEEIWIEEIRRQLSEDGFRV